MTAVFSCLYVLLLLTAIINLVWIRRPRGEASLCFEVMIPARNEAHNLPDILPPLLDAGVHVSVYDDASTDETGMRASELGAKVITSEEPLPSGWTGKNRACHMLSLLANDEWTVFLDADNRPSPAFAGVLAAELTATPPTVKCVTGFSKMLPGRGIEPLYLGWVPWILLATNPFGLVERTSRGHNRFTNGQFTAWRTDYLHELRPFEFVRGEVLEDIKIGRLLAMKGEPVSVLNMSQILSVRMYEHVGQAVEGMLKNSGQIANTFIGSMLFAAFFVAVGVGWAFCGPYALPLYGVLVTSKLVTDRIVGYPAYTAPFIPITCLAAAMTVVWSALLKRRGRIQWKGRTYP